MKFPKVLAAVMSRVVCRWAYRSWRNGDLEKAIAGFSRAIDFNPKRARLYFNRGWPLGKDTSWRRRSKTSRRPFGSIPKVPWRTTSGPICTKRKETFGRPSPILRKRFGSIRNSRRTIPTGPTLIGPGANGRRPSPTLWRPSGWRRPGWPPCHARHNLSAEGRFRKGGRRPRSGD